MIISEEIVGSLPQSGVSWMGSRDTVGVNNRFHHAHFSTLAFAKEHCSRD